MTALAPKARAESSGAPTALLECQDRVHACEDALDRGDKVISVQADTIGALDAQNQRLQKSLDFALSEASKAGAEAHAWYRDPKLLAPLALTAGIALGAYVTRTVTK